MATHEVMVIHNTRHPLELDALLGKDFRYFSGESIADFAKIDALPAPLFQGTRLNLKSYQTALFLFDITSPWLDDLSILSQLPANQIIYAEGIPMDLPTAALLDRRGAHALPFDSMQVLATLIRQNFFGGQWGMRLSLNGFTLTAPVGSTWRQNGQRTQQLSLDATDGYVIATQDRPVWVGKDTTNLLVFECDTTSDLTLTADIIDYSSGMDHVIRRRTVTDKALRTGVVLGNPIGGVYVQMQLRVKGAGMVTLGTVNVTQGRGEYGAGLPGARRLPVRDELGGTLRTYFDAGNMKPPLLVYFGGYHMADTFEGFFMMRQLEHPFILVTDPRLEGGAFYLSTPEVEETLVRTILQVCEAYGFTRKQLILMGLSMGTFGALYYGAKIQPRAVVVGKPITNIGDVAENKRLLRPEEFATAFDVVNLVGGSLDEAGIQRTNQRFWDVFEAADLSKTTFAIAYMMEDDYDPRAFKRIWHSLKSRDPLTRILAKGLTGRHNDNSAGIVDWFIRMTRRLIVEVEEEA